MRRRALALSSLVLSIAVLVAARSLGTLVIADPWTETWFIAAVTGVGVLTATFLLLVVAWPRGKQSALAVMDPLPSWRSMLLFTFGGALAGVWWLLARFGGENLVFDPTPNRQSAHRVAELAASSAALIRDEVAPLESSAPIAVLLVAGVLSVTLVAHLCLIAGTPALSAVPVLALWLPTIAFAQSVPPVVFAGTLAALLAVLALTSSVTRPANEIVAGNHLPKRSGNRRWRIRTRQVASVATAGALVVALAGAGRAATLSDEGAVRWFQPTNFSYAGGVFDGDIDLTQDLSRLSDAEVFRYATSDGLPAGPLSTRTLFQFDGQMWTSDPANEPNRLSAELLMNPHEGIPAGKVAVKLGFIDPTMPILPVPADAWATRERGPWQYNQTTRSLESFGEVATIGFIIERDRWTAESLRQAEQNHSALLAEKFPDVDAGKLLDAARVAASHAMRDNGVVPNQPFELALDDGTTVRLECPDGRADCAWGGLANPATGRLEQLTIGIDPALLVVPVTEHADEVAQQAREIVGDAETSYDKAVALQDWLRNPANFTYELRAPNAESGDLVYDFLTERTGYCVHFATAMAIMARHLGIPARVVSGFLAGQEADGQFIVTANQAHMWPELMLPGAGWVRFEPTPASVSGAAPSHAVSPTSLPNLAEDDALLQTSNVPANPVPQPAATNPTAMTAADRAELPQRLAIAGSAAVLAAAGAFATVQVARRRRILDPDAAWHEATRIWSRRGIEVPEAATPRQAVAAVDAEWRSKHHEALPKSARNAFADLAQLVEQHRYLPEQARQQSQRGPNHHAACLAEIRRTKRPRRFGLGRRAVSGRSVRVES